MYKIGVIKGDGTGPEVIDEALKVLHATPFIFKIPRRKLILSMKIWILPIYGVQPSFTTSVAQ